MKNQKIIQAQLRMEDITVIPHCLGEGAPEQPTENNLA